MVNHVRLVCCLLHSLFAACPCLVNERVHVSIFVTGSTWKLLQTYFVLSCCYRFVSLNFPTMHPQATLYLTASFPYSQARTSYPQVLPVETHPIWPISQPNLLSGGQCPDLLYLHHFPYSSTFLWCNYPCPSPLPLAKSHVLISFAITRFQIGLPVWILKK